MSLSRLQLQLQLRLSSYSYSRCQRRCFGRRRLQVKWLQHGYCSRMTKSATNWLTANMCRSKSFSDVDTIIFLRLHTRMHQHSFSVAAIESPLSYAAVYSSDEFRWIKQGRGRCIPRFCCSKVPWLVMVWFRKRKKKAYGVLTYKLRRAHLQ